MECPVCFEVKDKDKTSLLDCDHFLCKLCLRKLVNHICPLCRHPIGPQFLNNRDIIWDSVDMYDFDFSIERRVRRRRNREMERRNVIQNVTQPIPEIISMQTMNEIFNETYISVNHNQTFVSDKRKQKFRHNRNRWQEQSVKTTRIWKR